MFSSKQSPKKEVTKYPLRRYGISFGADPEFFFTKGKEVIGSEKILKGDIEARDEYNTPYGKVIIDGVQAELNPAPSSCREAFATNLSQCFREVANLTKKDKNLNVSFTQVVTVGKKEFDSLSDDSKKFGCAESQNVYNKKSSITVDPNVYRKRSAGGHIHMGANAGSPLRKVLETTDVLIPIMDLIVGNTCVLIDRNPDNKERRKNYGRAGEFRVQPHGMEYRTLSNFWLQSYQLMSFVMGLSRLAVSIVADSNTDSYGRGDKTEDFAKNLLKLVDRKKVEEAINNNNFVLAYSNFIKIQKYLFDIVGTNTNNFPLNSENVDDFKYFIKKGVNHWFKQDPLEHWLRPPIGNGWENFLHTTVHQKRTRNVRLKKTVKIIRNTLGVK